MCYREVSNPQYTVPSGHTVCYNCIFNLGWKTCRPSKNIKKVMYIMNMLLFVNLLLLYKDTNDSPL